MKQAVFEYELPIEVESQSEGGFVAKCPIWPACYAQGETFDEAVLEITAVAQSLIELSKEEGLDIPLKLRQERTSIDPLTVPVIVT